MKPRHWITLVTFALVSLVLIGYLASSGDESLGVSRDTLQFAFERQGLRFEALSPAENQPVIRGIPDDGRVLPMLILAGPTEDVKQAILIVDFETTSSSPSPVMDNMYLFSILLKEVFPEDYPVILNWINPYALAKALDQGLTRKSFGNVEVILIQEGLTGMLSIEPKGLQSDYITDDTLTQIGTPLPQIEPWDRSATTIVRENDGAEMVLVLEGEFLMGSTEAEVEDAEWSCLDSTGRSCLGNYDNETPQHTVYLDGFQIDRLEISNAQYRKCIVAGICQESAKYANDSDFNSSNQPAIVDWENANKYCEWVGARLPTEAEWEKAARGTEGLIYPWGNEWDETNVVPSYRYQKTTRVDSGPPSPYGTLNMVDNASEWVADWYARGYYAESPEYNPPGPEEGEDKVIRGRGTLWFPFSSEQYRTARRWHWLNHWVGNPQAGFRCAQNFSED